MKQIPLEAQTSRIVISLTVYKAFTGRLKASFNDLGHQATGHRAEAGR